MEELNAFSEKNQELRPLEKIINNVSENLKTDDYYKNAGKLQLRVDIQLLIDSLETLENLENLNFKKATPGQKEVERRRRKLNIQCLEVLLKCKELENKLFDKWLPPNHPILELDHNATSNRYLVDLK